MKKWFKPGIEELGIQATKRDLQGAAKDGWTINNENGGHEGDLMGPIKTS